MDSEVQRKLSELEEKSYGVFLDFMTRIAKFDELVEVGKQFLIGFHREVEMFRRPQLHKTSEMVDDIIKANCTNRMKSYVEAGCKHPNQNMQNIIKLRSCEQGFQEHLLKVKVLLDELERLKEDAIGLARMTNQSASLFLDKYSCESMGDQVTSFEEEIEPVHLQEKSMSYVTMMAIIYGMLNLDYAMQENIIQSINLSTSSPQLESYCLMWDLRPYINDNVMRLAWKYIP
ncbi:uncharacterized protein LOC103719828 isoform X1 [Phoenix dactylifera]|uniref:Uncharacterized protein LOC103719828 isoform X1 n=1 Tax=Phoenix dactylifera TaxID=42345 RepID=A0A8B8JB95_PHODC|nr:uncharacterized protein LOC103719828 isoform X1 [Phoenix dactylifera]XP_026665322.2 uncharacterized protein LOC103719828 isoform X1 [Phoenix dactylifera]XP_038987354.1 uncharacterized protein LOC103719828 isoform X1 [Phoenix dactylifera]